MPLTLFPSGIDTFANPSASDLLSDPSYDHATQHSKANDALLALQTKVGTDGSSVVSTLDYLVKSPAALNPGHQHSRLKNSAGTGDALVADADGVLQILNAIRFPDTAIPSAICHVQGDRKLGADPEFVFDGSKNRLGIGLGGPVTNVHVLGEHVEGVGMSLMEAVGVNHAFSSTSCATNAQSGIILRKTDGPKWYVFSEAVTHEFRISQGVGNTRLTILSGGNTGIGTTAPTARLHVADTPGATLDDALKVSLLSDVGLGAPIALDATASVSGRVWALASTGSGSAVGAGRFILYDSTADAIRLVCDNLGNIAIGAKATPAATLDIGAGTIALDETADPSAPASGSAVVYARDNGGKTELVVRFPTGAVQAIAIEP